MRLKSHTIQNEHSAIIRFFNHALMFSAYWTMAFSLFFLLVVLQTGHFPTFSQPDPKDTFMGWLIQPLLLGSTPFVILSLLVGLVSTLVQPLAITPFSWTSVRKTIYFLTIIVLVLIQQSELLAWLVD